MNTPSFPKQCLAEAIGTFFLVFAGTGSIIINTLTGGAVSQVGIGLTFGAIVMIMITTLGPVSGAHINPAVTLALAFLRLFPAHRVAGYIASQLTGAVLASVVLLVLFGNVANLGASLPSGPVWQSLVLEFLLSLLLMLVILRFATGPDANPLFAALAIGVTVGMEATFAGPLCGASMNPARSLGPAIISGNLTHHWIYWIGPITGMLAASVLHQTLYRKLPSASVI